MLLSNLVKEDQERYNQMTEMERLDFEATRFQLLFGPDVIMHVLFPTTIIAGGVSCAGFVTTDDTKLRHYSVTNVFVRRV